MALARRVGISGGISGGLKISVSPHHFEKRKVNKLVLFAIKRDVISYILKTYH